MKKIWDHYLARTKLDEITIFCVVSWHILNPCCRCFQRMSLYPTPFERNELFLTASTKGAERFI